MSHPVSGGDASLAKHPASWVWRLALSQAFRSARMSLVHKSVHETVVRVPGRDGAVRSVGFMLDRLPLLPLTMLQGERVILREPRESDVDDRLRHPIDPEEEDGYGSSWRREWDGRRYHTREHLARQQPPEPGTYTWMVEYDGHCIGSARLQVDVDQHCATYAVGLFVAALRGRGLGREVTRLVLDWAFDVLGAHRVQLEVLASNSRAINCYVACGFHREGARREAELYPDGWKDFIMMGILRSEYATQAKLVSTDSAQSQPPPQPTVLQ